MPKPLVSFVFPTYNRIDEVNTSLNIFRQQISIPYEVIIVDNSEKPVEYQLNENEHYFWTGENLGTYARNIGIDRATAPFVLMLDDDSHPLDHTLETAIDYLQQADFHVGGVTARIERLDKGVENPPLLPSAFHGCGALFRAECLKQINDFYPKEFCFYGEEYYSTLKLYQAGYVLNYMNDFRICHRMSSTGRDKAKILYYLTLNNRRTWQPFVPDQYLKAVEFDTAKRYELISAKENVFSAYEAAMAVDIAIPERMKMTDPEFRSFSYLDKFDELIENGAIKNGDAILLCSCGKFPTMWAAYLEEQLNCTIQFVDFNSGLINQRYGDYEIYSPDHLLDFVQGQGFMPLVGHSARLDTFRWKELFQKHDLNYLQLSVEELY